MSKIYDTIDEPEIVMKDITLPKNFPAIYIDENDNIYCYHSIIEKDRFLLGSQPYWLKGEQPSKIKDQIKGYFVIQNGTIFSNERFIDEEDYFDSKRKCKLLLASVHLPDVSDTSYSICCNSKYGAIEDDLTRKIFVLTYDELKELLEAYNKTLKCIPNSMYRKYPSITRTMTSDNFCEISDTWIPPKFPYITFAESGYCFSHISLYGFYEHIKFLTMRDTDSYISQLLIENGLNKDILERLFNIRNYGHLNKRITRDLYFELNDIE